MSKGTKLAFLFLTILSIVITYSCTQQSRSKKWGGTYTVDLPTGKKLINATWKNSDLWILTSDRDIGDPISEYEFKEDSPYRVIEGVVKIKEH